MPGKPHNQKRWAADCRLFDSSEAARRIYACRTQIEVDLRSPPVKVIPVSRLARIFGISERLIWKWIELKLLSTCCKPPDQRKYYKKGISAKSAENFLKRLAECSELVWNDESDSKPLRWAVPRATPAAEKCREGLKLLQDREFTPSEYARTVGVSVSTVYRLLSRRRLPYVTRTKHRILISNSRRKSRKSPLTPKNGRKAG